MACPQDPLPSKEWLAERPAAVSAGRLRRGQEGAAMLHVIAIITAVPGRRDALLEAFLANVPAVRAETGCIEYAPAIDADFGAFQALLGPDTFVVVEKWTDAEALRAHADAPHMAAYHSKTDALVASAPIHVLLPA